MQESEFRDWARRAQGDFNERLKALETQVAALSGGPVRFRLPKHYRGFEGLLGRVRDEVAGGMVTGLGVALVREDGVADMWWVAEDFDQYGLAGAVSQLNAAILHRLAEAAGAAQGEKAPIGGSDLTDEGKPLAHAAEAAAPAGVA